MAENLGADWDGSVPSAATAVVKRIEGFFSKPYDDNGSLPGGTWTIGYGTIIDGQGRPVTPATPPVTEAEAEALLMRDMRGAAQDVATRVKVPLLTREAAALISWTYNLGGGNLAKSTMLTRINANNKAASPGSMACDSPCITLPFPQACKTTVRPRCLKIGSEHSGLVTRAAHCPVSIMGPSTDHSRSRPGRQSACRRGWASGTARCASRDRRRRSCAPRRSAGRHRGRGW